MWAAGGDFADVGRGEEYFLSTTRKRGIPMRRTAAPLWGGNVVATKIGGQLYYEKIPGVIFIPAEDPEALSNAILSVVKKEKNRAHVEDFLVKEFGLKKWANDVTEIYLEKMKERR